MCNFCKKDELGEFNTTTLFSKRQNVRGFKENVDLDIYEDGTVCVNIYDPNGSTDNFTTIKFNKKIKYCPLCGEKL